MLDVSRTDIISDSFMDFPTADRFIKLPINSYLNLLGITPNTSQTALINAINNPKYGFVCAAISRRQGKTYIANVIGQLLPGRFIMGLGSSSQTIMTQFNGIPLDKPVTRVKETAQLVKEMLTGAKTDFDGDTLFSKGYRQAPLENPPPVYLAALRPKMIEMAAEVGDGVIFNLWPKKALPKMMEHVAIGAKSAGKDPQDLEIVNRAMVLCTDDKEYGRNVFRAAFGPYYGTPVYNNFLAWAGYEAEAAGIAEGWAAKDRDKTAGSMSDEMIDEIAIFGNEDEVRARIQEDADGGVETHIIAPMAGKAEDVDRTFNAFIGSSFQFSA